MDAYRQDFWKGYRRSTALNHKATKDEKQVFYTWQMAAVGHTLFFTKVKLTIHWSYFSWFLMNLAKFIGAKLAESSTHQLILQNSIIWLNCWNRLSCYQSIRDCDPISCSFCLGFSDTARFTYPHHLYEWRRVANLRIGKLLTQHQRFTDKAKLLLIFRGCNKYNF